MTVHMQGFAIQKLYQDGKVSEKGIFGNYDGKKAQIIAMDDGKVGRGTLSNHDIAALLSMRASPHSLVERLEDDLGRGHHHRGTRRHRRHRHHRHHRKKATRSKHARRHARRHAEGNFPAVEKSLRRRAAAKEFEHGDIRQTRELTKEEKIKTEKIIGTQNKG